jgi:hypothetical protein
MAMTMRSRLALVALGAVVLALSAACGGDDADSSEPPVNTPEPGRIVVDAPIDEAEQITRESFPPPYTVRVVVGLVNGCHQFEKAETERSGTTIEIKAYSNTVDDPDAVCTQIYGMHEETVELGSGADYDEGVEYTVVAGDFEFTIEGTGEVEGE